MAYPLFPCIVVLRILQVTFNVGDSVATPTSDIRFAAWAVEAALTILVVAPVEWDAHADVGKMLESNTRCPCKTLQLVS
jgi:hypothetical protein